MRLQTTWFGSFLVDEGKVVQQRLFPPDPQALADRLARVEDWKVLDEERELMGSVAEVFVTEPRLERAGGRFTAERAPFLDPGAYGYDRTLLHAAMVELAKRRMRKAIRTEDHLRQAVAAVDDLLDQENGLVERIREWYGLHFPELAKMVDEAEYLELVAKHGRREKLPMDARESVGAELGEPEEREIQGMARLAQSLAAQRADLEGYVEKTARGIAPNVAELAGPMIAARLVTLAGSVEDLARYPAGTVQLLGAERALFRHLKTQARPPKHGVLFQHPLIHRAPPWQRGALARAFAGRIVIAARADAYTHRHIAPELQADLDRTVAEIRRRKEEKPARRGPKPSTHARARRRR
ncbi:MAG TPA: ribosomal biogenesis protein [Thermoplasmata archaeon]|nr:ribosomal biogenesis protein [Thermoplasmata archaeon]